jgi:PKD repeat protein
LGLSHDGKTDGTAYYSGQGTGDTGWAPIMGVGYYKNLSQWSKGEYALANNTQDDLAIITSYIAYRPDDHGNDHASATILPAGSTISTSGVIERNTDIDVFRFQTGAGTIALDIIPFERGPNLDVLAELYDSDGNLIATNNPADFLYSDLTLTVPAGTYYLHVRGAGTGDPLGTGYTGYGSLGQYSITGTIIDATGSLPPIAVASATPNSGDAPLAVQFSSAGSSDADGVIVTYAWDFGDGTTSLAANPTHTFTSVGNYTVTLIVVDNNDLSDATTIPVSVLLPNVRPAAYATATPSSGYAPLSVTLDGSASYDPDGSIVSYQWNFGDGTTGSGATVAHTYQNVGSYTATLTVTDNRGGIATTAVPVQTQQDPNKFVRVASISLSSVTVTGGKQVKATVKITNPSNQVVSGATVTGQFSGAVTGTGNAVTDASGNALITSKKFKKGTVTFTVTGVVKSGYVYSPAQNVVTSATISAAPTP